MFFYRPWDLNGRLQSIDYGTAYEDPLNNLLYSQFIFHRWGYAALMILTILASLCLNSAYLLSFIGNPGQRKTPHWALFCLCIRDLLVTLILIPASIDWFVVQFGVWNSGQIWCSMAGFFDFTLATMYPLILLAFAIILYTRAYHPPNDQLDLPMGDIDPLEGPEPGGVLHTSSRAPSVANSYTGRTSKPPSIIGSENGYRNRPNMHQRVMQNQHNMRHGGQHAPAQKSPFYVAPNRPGSVTGSIEGRLAAGRMSGGRRQQTPSLDGSRMSDPNHPGMRHQRSSNFRASSPLHEVDENMSLGDADDLWDQASLDYPGREFDQSSPRGWDFMEMEVKYHTWHVWLLIIFCLTALSMGIPAAMFMEVLPNTRPGCSIPVNPFSNPHSSVIDDVGYNFILSFIIINYMIFSVILVAVLLLICYRRMADKRFATFIKILTVLTAIYFVSRSPVDIFQFKSLIEASMGFNLRDKMEIEYEILLVWATWLPLVLNPIVYFSFLGEYRKGTMKVVRQIFGCQSMEDRKEEKMAKYKEEEILASRDEISKTQVSNIL